MNIIIYYLTTLVIHIIAPDFIADSSVVKSSIDITCEQKITAEKKFSPTQITEGLPYLHREWIEQKGL